MISGRRFEMYDIREFAIFDNESVEDFIVRIRGSNLYGTLEIKNHVIRELLLRDLKFSDNIEELKDVIKDLIEIVLYK